MTYTRTKSCMASPASGPTESRPVVLMARLGAQKKISRGVGMILKFSGGLTRNSRSLTAQLRQEASLCLPAFVGVASSRELAF